MKWTSEHNILLGREILALELWKFKSGTRERGQCLENIAENLNGVASPVFMVTSRGIRDRIKLLERNYKNKERAESQASGIAPPPPTELDEIMREFIEKSSEAEEEANKILSEKYEKNEKEKPQAEDMRNKAMERLSETKRRSDDIPSKQRSKRSASDTIDYLKTKFEKESDLKKAELEFKKKKEENQAAHQALMLQQQQTITNQFQEQMSSQNQQFNMMCQMMMSQTQALLEVIKKRQ